MLYLGFFLFLLLAAVIIILFTSALVFVEYKRQDWDDFLLIKLKAIWGIIRYEFVIPLADVDKNGIKLKKVEEKTFGKEKRKDERLDVKIADIFKKASFYRSMYKQNAGIICRVRDFLRDRLFLDEYRLEASIGLGDAFITALFNGIAWTAAGILTSFFLNNFKAREKCVEIKNDFNRIRFDVLLRCIFRTRFVHIIIVVFMLLKSFRSIKKDQKQSIGGGVVG